MSKPVTVLHLGDLHVGSDTALAKPGFRMGSKQNRRYEPSEFQERLYDALLDIKRRIKREARGGRLIVEIGGDNIDGPIHHHTTQTQGTRHDARRMAVELLEPFVDMADEAYGTLGTAAHVGDQGDDDAAVYETLGVPYRHKWAVEIGGKLVWWAHHGVNIGKREWTLENDMALTAKDIAMFCDRKRVRTPDLVIAHHVHRSPTPVSMRGVMVATVPCWQGSTTHGYRIAPHKPTDIGALVWRPGEMPEAWLYDIQNNE